MKVPLRYQMTEYDCGPTALMNAIQYLYEEDEIPPDFPKRIWGITLDGYSDNGVAYRTGTTASAMRFFGDWLNHFGEMTGYPVQAEFLEKDEVHVDADSRLCREVENGAAAVVRCIFDVGHYITLTGIEGDFIKAWDPYWMDKRLKLDGVIYADDHPKEYNRLIRRDVLESENGTFYALSRIDKRDALILKRTEGKTRRYAAFH